AAEIAVPLAADILNAVRDCGRTLYETITAKAERIKLMVRNFDSENMELQFRAIEHPLIARFDSAKESLLNGLQQRLSDGRHQIQNCIAVLENASPKTILARGYSMVRDKETQEIVRDAALVPAGRELEIFPAAGKITARVEQAPPSNA
ncbi:MAG: exodeoxyribonuclease VII large subunit, partial [Treponemataceae bacterium]|nr:exodeoxyribonuclease VII large subunit [Treponemataceae bacterium]